MTAEQEILDLKIRVEKLERALQSMLLNSTNRLSPSNNIMLCRGRENNIHHDPGIDVLSPIYGK